MSAAFKMLGRDVLRLSLAAMLFIASFAGARLQGEMGSFAASANGMQITLCSGAVLAADADGLPGDKRHADCTMCNLPVANAVQAPQVQRDLAIWSAPTHTARPVPVRFAATRIFFARGPPHLG